MKAAKTSGTPGAQDSAGDAWPDVPDVPGVGVPEPLPLDALPDVARGAVVSISDSLQVPADLSALFALVSAAATVADRVDVRIRDGHREPLALYAAGIADPGERKSPVFARMCGPLYRWERERARTEEPRRRLALDQVDVLRGRLTDLKKSSVKGGAIPDELEDARIKLDAAERDVPPSSSLILDDVTPERLAMEMADQGGRAAIFSAEGDVLRIFAGRYGNGDPRADLLKKAINGEPTRVSRVTREPVWLPRPILTVGLMFQPSLLPSLNNRDSLEGEGVFARFLFVQPVSALGSRLTGRDMPEPDRQAEERYAQALTRLLYIPPVEVRDDGERVPHVLDFTPEAVRVMFAFEAEIEAMLGPSGELRPISGWGAKLFGYTCRIAAILELLKRAALGDDLPGGPIGLDSAEGAVRIARALSTHARKVLGELHADQHTSDLIYIWKKCVELDAHRPEDGLTLATLRRATQGRRSVEGAEDVERLVGELEDRGCVRLRPQVPTGGRPRADRIEIHPEHRKQGAESAKRPTDEDVGCLAALSASQVTARSFADPDPLEIIQEVRS